jgi:DinB superfamily
MISHVVEQLESTPDILRTLLSHVSQAEADWKPAPQRFSIAEVLVHLYDTETQVFRTRVQRMVNEDCPQLATYDQEAIAAAGGYAGQGAQETLQNFHNHRTANLTYLKSLPAEIGDRVGMHPELGPITIAQLLNEWAFHDLGHLRQMAELVRAYRFYPNLGAFQKYYTVNP